MGRAFDPYPAKKRFFLELKLNFTPAPWPGHRTHAIYGRRRHALNGKHIRRMEGELFLKKISDPFKPYHHLGHEPFWQLVPRNASQTATYAQQPMAAEPAPSTTVGSSHPSYTLKGMRAAYAYAQIDEELFDLLHDETVRAHLRTILISTYLAPHARQLPILETIALLGSLASVIA